ncbi:unnamed protein product [Somion occarium]|uniref:Uncharacterized protein n=1 Tax=Somion occarium TaxID=3059160 RepID=A0ABP1EBL0_9APHY
MRSSTVLAIAIASAAVPAFAAPTTAIPQDESGALNFQDVKDFGQGFVDGFTKTLSAVAPFAGLLLREDDESGALSFQDVKDFGKGVVDGFTHTVEEVTPAIQAVGGLVQTAAPLLSHFQGRELIARAIIEARQEQGLDESGALSFDDITNGLKKAWDTVGPIVKAVAPIAEAAAPLLLRDVDESGVLSWQDVKDFGKGFVDGFTNTVESITPAVQAVGGLVQTAAPLLSHNQGRELVARAIIQARHEQGLDVSGALSFHDITDGLKKAWDTVSPIVKTVAPIAEAAAPLLLRDVSSQPPPSTSPYLDESGALSFDDITNGIKKVFDTVAPIVKTVAPIVEAAAPLFLRDVDESGALSWQDVKDFGKGFVDGFTDTLQSVTPAVQAVGGLIETAAPLLNHAQGRELVARGIIDSLGHDKSRGSMTLAH